MYDLVDRPVDRLPAADRLVLAALRRWVQALTLAGTVPAPAAMGAAAGALDAALRLIEAGSSDELAIGRPCLPTVTEDEAVLLGLWRLVRGGDRAGALGLAALLVDEGRAAPLVAAVAAGLG